MEDIRIDRLTLRVPELSASDAARLATLVADGLAATDLSAAASLTGVLRVDIEAGGELSLLSRRIVAQIVRQLVRSG
jgi:hypothetical protein